MHSATGTVRSMSIGPPVATGAVLWLAPTCTLAFLPVAEVSMTRPVVVWVGAFATSTARWPSAFRREAGQLSH